jgi:hypothetical protein
MQYNDNGGLSNVIRVKRNIMIMVDYLMLLGFKCNIMIMVDLFNVIRVKCIIIINGA